jgi:hypothetical protein
VTLDSWESPDDLYLARGDDVSEFRPLFTGDVLDDIAVPGVQDAGRAMVLAHPCSMRGKDAHLAESILLAAVENHEAVPAYKWEQGYLNRMPLPELDGPEGSFAVAWLDRIGLAQTPSIISTRRLACLSPVGVNILQQRLVVHLTRVEIPTSKFWEAFAHTSEEVDLLEEWTEELADSVEPQQAAADFDSWIRAENRQGRLRDPQQRASVRAAMRTEIHHRRY